MGPDISRITKPDDAQPDRRQEPQEDDGEYSRSPERLREVVGKIEEDHDIEYRDQQKREPPARHSGDACEHPDVVDRDESEAPRFARFGEDAREGDQARHDPNRERGQRARIEVAEVVGEKDPVLLSACKRPFG